MKNACLSSYVFYAKMSSSMIENSDANDSDPSSSSNSSFSRVEEANNTVRSEEEEESSSVASSDTDDADDFMSYANRKTKEKKGTADLFYHMSFLI